MAGLHTFARRLVAAGALLVALAPATPTRASGLRESSPVDVGEGVASEETGLIRAHLARVERVVRARDTSGLSASQRAARALALDRLHTYWLAGRFPKNRDFPGRRVPYLIDADGTPCAVAHLLLESGETALGDRLILAANNARVPDIDDPGFERWLEASGLLRDEAALIQPTYCDDACWGYSEPVCGEDGRVYSNYCFLGCSYTAAGPCPCDGTPVCASDGRVYPNLCQALCAGTTPAEGGSCDAGASEAGAPHCGPPDAGPHGAPRGTECKGRGSRSGQKAELVAVH
jgi:hypothetical protein